MLQLPEGGAKHGFLKLLGCEDLLEGCSSSDLDEAPMVVVLGDGKEQLQSRLHTLAHHEDARLVAAVGAVSERLVDVSETTPCEVRRQDLQIYVLHSCWLGGTDPFALLARVLVAKKDGVDLVILAEEIRERSAEMLSQLAPLMALSGPSPPVLLHHSRPRRFRRTRSKQPAADANATVLTPAASCPSPATSNAALAEAEQSHRARRSAPSGPVRWDLGGSPLTTTSCLLGALAALFLVVGGGAVLRHGSKGTLASSATALFALAVFVGAPLPPHSPTPHLSRPTSCHVLHVINAPRPRGIYRFRDR